MPQMEVEWFASQVVWLIIAFSILYYLLSRRALPRVAEILEARQDRIAADLDQAQRLRREAEEALARYEQVVDRAHVEAHAVLAETQGRLQAEASARQGEVDARLTSQMADAEARIGAARDSALRELEETAADVAQSAVERLGGVQVSRETAQSALRSVMAEAA